MSGGSMDYLSYKLLDASFRENTPERRALRAHLKLVSEALHLIEWNDSGDGANGEAEAIRACLAPGAVLTAAIEQARVARDELTCEIDRAEKGKRGVE